MRERFEGGTCDECGDAAEELILIDGQWMCRGCSQLVPPPRGHEISDD